jgi:O-antigen/teichoic acid export membrane protein
MSRLRLFLHGVLSNYVALAANVVFSLLYVPLALHSLTKEQFGVWALLNLLVSYLWLIDAGMSPSISRVLIECKDQPGAGRYGSLIQTGFWICAAQGLLVLVAGLALAPWASRLFQIPASQQATFCCLIQWQSLIAAAMFATRMFRNLLYAHQRIDLVSYSQAGAALVALLVLWIALRRGAGMMSILWSNAFQTAFLAALTGWHCLRLHLFPAPGAWGRALWSEFRELFDYGKDVFIVQIGSMLILASQPVIVSRSLGLEAVAAWSVGTKVFNLLGNLFWQGFDTSTSALSEMLVRDEQERLRQRFTGMVVVMLVLCGVVAVVYAACNSLFVTVWTQGRILWPVENDLLLGLWLLLSVLVHANGGLIVLTRRIAGLRFILVVEGVAFILLASAVVPHGGIPAMVAASILCSLCCSGAYGIRRVHQFFQLRWPELERRWLISLGQIILLLIPFALATWWATSTLNNLPRLGLNAVIVGGLSGYLFLRCGIPHELQAEILQRMPPKLRGRMGRLITQGKDSP